MKVAARIRAIYASKEHLGDERGYPRSEEQRRTRPHRLLWQHYPERVRSIPLCSAIKGRNMVVHRVSATVWLTGLSGAGKSTLADALEATFYKRDLPSFVLDGDALRAGLNRDLAFARKDRRENIRRIAEVARLFNRAGMFVIVAAISPYRDDRAAARSVIGSDRFVEVFVNTPLAICERCDPKGLYRRARSGVLIEFTGISAPYEVPLSPDLSVNGADSVERNVRTIFDLLSSRFVMALSQRAWSQLSP